MLQSNIMVKLDEDAKEFIKVKGGKVWVKSVCVSGCCGIEGFEPQFMFEEQEGEWVEFTMDDIKIYLHPSITQHKKLVVRLQRVLGFKSLMGYLT